MENPKRPNHLFMEKIFPDACPELLIHYGDPFQIKTSKGAKKQPRGFIFGPLSKSIEIGPTGKTGVISVRFYPGGLYPFISTGINTLINKQISLNKVFGSLGIALEEGIINAKSFNQRKKILESFLISILSMAKKRDLIIPFRMTALIANNLKPVNVETLSKELYIGQRHLERKFINQVGLSPKMLIKIIRFQNIFKLLKKKRFKTLAELTQEAGYYDQSHFIKNFKEFTGGQSPKAYFKQDTRITKLFTGGF